MVKRKHLKTLSILLLAGVFMASLPAQAAPDPFANVHNLKLSFSVYLGGLHLMDSSADFKRTGQNYRLSMQAGTQGLVRSLMPWDADLNSTGQLKKDKIRPTKGVIVTKWEKKPARVEFQYANGKHKKMLFDPQPDMTKNEAVPDKMRQEALDPLNAIMQMMTSFAYDKGCAQSLPIFDGHRRFDVTLKDAGEEMLEGESYSIFTGMAMKCHVDLHMRAGSRKDREGSRFWEDMKNKGTRPPIHIYLAKVKEDLPILPVRAETETFFGTVMVHLTAVEDSSTKKTSSR
jgi:hypothetical protein